MNGQTTDLAALEADLLARVTAANDEASLEALRVEALGKQGSISALMKNLGAILEAAGTSLQGVVKTTVFLSDMGDFAAMNEVYAKHFGDHKPARSTVQAAGLPRNVKVEIEAIARVG